MKQPTIGELKRRAVIRAWQDEPDDTTGIDQTFDSGKAVWARIDPIGSALFYGTQQVEANVTHRLVTWRTDRVNADAIGDLIGGGHVVDSGGMRYRVRRATDMNGERWFVMLDLEQLGVIPS